VTSPRPPVPNATARRLFELVEPIAVVTYMAPEPTKAVLALGAGTDEYRDQAEAQAEALGHP
jgi:hypothetical protein